MPGVAWVLRLWARGLRLWRRKVVVCDVGCLLGVCRIVQERHPRDVGWRVRTSLRIPC
jgi:hypothetical protein